MIEADVLDRLHPAADDGAGGYSMQGADVDPKKGSFDGFPEGCLRFLCIWITGALLEANPRLGIALLCLIIFVFIINWIYAPREKKLSRPGADAEQKQAPQPIAEDSRRSNTLWDNELDG